MTNKKSEPNPIEEAIGERAKTPEPNSPLTPVGDLNDLPENVRIPDEMLTLEELNHQTEERLQQDEPEEEMTTIPITTAAGKTANVPQAAMPPQKTLASKPDPQPVTKTSFPESPLQKIETNPDDDFVKEISELPQKIDEVDESQDAEKGPQFELKEAIGIRGCSLNPPAEDIEFTALKKYIQEDGFVLSTVAFHIVTLCAQPMVTPSTTTWDYRDRASIPDMVLALLNQPGYLEGIWPSLKIVMSSNKGNAAWCAGIATTIAFFDVVRTLPAVKELSNEENEKKS